MQYSTVQYSTVRCVALHCIAVSVQYNTVQCRIVQYTAVQCCAMQCIDPFRLWFRSSSSVKLPGLLANNNLDEKNLVALLEHINNFIR